MNISGSTERLRMFTGVKNKYKFDCCRVITDFLTLLLLLLLLHPPLSQRAVWVLEYVVCVIAVTSHTEQYPAAVSHKELGENCYNFWKIIRQDMLLCQGQTIKYPNCNTRNIRIFCKNIFLCCG